jgi:chitin synthase
MVKIAQKAPKEVRNISDEEKQEDYYKGFRSSVVLVWIFCNFALGAVVLSAAGLERISVEKDSGDQRSTIYMAVVLWSVAGLSLFRFIGAMWFLIVRMVCFFSTTRYTPFPTFVVLLTNLIYSVPRCLNALVK